MVNRLAVGLLLGGLVFARSAFAQSSPMTPDDMQAAMAAEIQATQEAAKERFILIANLAISEARRVAAEKRGAIAEAHLASEKKRADEAEAKLKAMTPP